MTRAVNSDAEPEAWTKRRLFARRSGVDRRREQLPIYWPERRRAERRSKGDRRAANPRRVARSAVDAVSKRGGRLAERPDRMAARVRDWLGRLPSPRR